MDALEITPPSDIQVFLEEFGRKPGRYHIPNVITHGPALSTLLRALDAAKTNLKSHRSRADCGLARHQKKTTEAGIQKLLQQFLSAVVAAWAREPHYVGYNLHVDPETVGNQLRFLGYSKDFAARVEAKIDHWLAVSHGLRRRSE